MVFGCEARKIRWEMRKRHEAVKMWFCSRMLKIPLRARSSNQELMQIAGVSRMLLGGPTKFKTRFFVIGSTDLKLYTRL